MIKSPFRGGISVFNARNGVKLDAGADAGGTNGRVGLVKVKAEPAL